jgi:hypothetical protein
MSVYVKGMHEIHNLRSSRPGKSICVMVLLCYLVVGYGIPLGVRSTPPPDQEAVRQQKGRALPKSMKTHSIWKIVKHVPSTQKISGPDQSCVIINCSPQFTGKGETLDDSLIKVLAYSHSPLHREPRAPPIS